MHKMNISEYKREKGDKVIYYGKVSLKKGYIFVDGDEYFYEFVGKNSCYSLLELLHPDDVQEFLELEKKLEDGPQYALLRMKCYNDRYRYLYVILQKNGRMFEDFASIDMSFCDFMSIRERYVEYITIVKKYRQFMSLSSDSFFEYIHDTDEMNIYRYVNRKSIPVLRRSLESIWAEISETEGVEEKDIEQFRLIYDSLKNKTERFEACIKVGVFENQLWNVRYHIKGCLLTTEQGNCMSVGIISALDSEEKKQSYYLSENALDPGTGLLNKRAINEYAVEKLQEQAIAGKGLYLAVMDVDDFKQINDRYGHMYGDEVLAKVAEIVKNVVDARGFTGRFGGDEFMVVMEGISTEQDLRRVLKTISKQIEWEFQDIKEGLVVTTSWGIAKFPDDGKSFEELFQKADKCLYIAKRKGKNRYIIYDEKKHGDIVNEKEALRNTGIKAMVSEEKKASVMSELVLQLNADGVEALPQAMTKMMEYFDMDGVAVYAGKDMQRICSVGDYVNPIQNLTCMQDEAYLKLFDDKGIYMESTINRLDNTYLSAYKLYQQQENGKFIQFVAFQEGRPWAVVAFDFFNRSPKLGSTDQGFITIVGRLMAQIALHME